MSITRSLTAALAVAALAAPAAQAQPDTHAAAAQSTDSATRGPLPGPPTWPINPQPITNAPAVDSATHGPAPGPPTWPANPQPITAASATKVTERDNRADWTRIALVIAGSLLALGGLTALAGYRSRGTHRSRTPA